MEAGLDRNWQGLKPRHSIWWSTARLKPGPCYKTAHFEVDTDLRHPKHREGLTGTEVLLRYRGWTVGDGQELGKKRGECLVEILVVSFLQVGRFDALCERP